MTTPRIASLTALAASLLFIIFTITQANTQSPEMFSAGPVVCLDTLASTGPECPATGPTMIGAVHR